MFVSVPTQHSAAGAAASPGHRPNLHILRKVTILPLLSRLHSWEPANTILREHLKLRLQFRLVQLQIIHRADPGDAHAWEPRAPSVHQGAADRAEVVGHVVPGGDGLALAVLREFVLAFDVLERAVFDDEVGGEHGGGDFAAVGACCVVENQLMILLGGVKSSVDVQLQTKLFTMSSPSTGFASIVSTVDDTRSV